MAYSIFTWSRKKIEDSARQKYPWLSTHLCGIHSKPLADHVELRIAATFDEDGSYKTFDILDCAMNEKETER